MTARSGARAREQRGSALLSAVVLLVLVGVVGIVLMRSTRRDVQSSLAQMHAREAYYLAQSGVETAREQLRSTQGALAVAAGPNGRIDFSIDTLRVVYDHVGRPIGFDGYGDDVPLRPFTLLGAGAYAAFVIEEDARGGLHVAALGASLEPSLSRIDVVMESAR